MTCESTLPVADYSASEFSRKVVRSDCQEDSQNRQLADQKETTVDDALVELREEKPAVLSLTL